LESVSPLVDYPSIHGGSVLLNIVMRWLQIEPGLLQLYIGKGTRMKDDNREQQIVISERILDGYSINDDPLEEWKSERPRRYFPRFPMIAFVPEEQISDLVLEQAPGRIIDIVSAPIDRPMLLIDGLGLDLEKDGPWS
jgi:hypothetical protein